MRGHGDVGRRVERHAEPFVVGAEVVPDLPRLHRIEDPRFVVADVVLDDDEAIDGGKVRVLSIPAIRDRVVQGALKLILERS
jgi:hypothetical protein